MFVAVIVVQWPLRLLALNLVDEGFVLQLADDVLHGRRLYADAVAYAWPGVFWLTAAAFTAFGTSIETARTLALVVFALAASLVYLIARWSAGRVGALGVVVIFVAYRIWAYPHWHMVNYSSVAMTAVLAAVWLSGQTLAQGGWRLALAAGVASGVSTLCKQDLGLATAGLLGMALLLVPSPVRLRRFVGYCAGGALVLGVAGAVLAAQGLLPALVQETIVAPLYGVQHFEYPGRPSLRPLLHQDAGLRAKAFSYLPGVVVDLHMPTLAMSHLWRETAVVDVVVKGVFYLPWLALLVAVPFLVRTLRRGDEVPQRPILVLWLAAVAATVAFNKPHDWVHLLVLYPPTILLAAALWARVAPGGVAGTIMRGVGWTAIALLVGASVWLGVEMGRAHDMPIRSARGTLYAPARHAAPLQALLDDLAARPEAPLAAWPYQPMVNFLSGRPPVSRHYILWPVDMNDRRDEEILQGLAARPDAEIVYSQMQVPHYTRPQVYAADLFGRLVDDWQVTRVFGGDPTGFTFLLLGHRQPAAGRSLLAQLADAPLTVTPADGTPQPVPPAQRARLLGTATWPFQHVLRMATPPSGWLTVSLPLTPAAGDRFETWYGTNPDYLATLFAPGARFAIDVATPGDGAHEVFAARLAPNDAAADRQWKRVSVDLTPWAGRAIELRLRVASLLTTGAGFARLDVAGWGDPRLVSGAPP